VHATAVAVDGHGVLIRGAPASGKSDLALRLLDRDADLIADDQVALRRDGNTVLASAPRTIAGKLEVRGIGIIGVRCITGVPVCLVVDLAAAGDAIERMPLRASTTLLGIAIPLIHLQPFEVSAAAKVRLAAAAAAKGILGCNE
jgi:serine kinase of HPr protein (carbohydrate metabolism regulator)